MNPTENQLDPVLQMLLRDKEDGFGYRRRKEEDWRENYTLYRDRVQYNRLTQRQTVNLPIMREEIQTLLKDVDDMPVLRFKSLAQDDQKELFLNEYWKWTLSPECNNGSIKDIVDKKQNFMFGRTFDQWQIIDGKVVWTIIDPEDILVPRYMDPTNIDSARYIIHTHIFKAIDEVERNPDYDKSAIHDLKLFHASEAGLIRSNDNQNMLNLKNQKMVDLGLSDADAPILGETVVELTMHFRKHSEGNDEEQIWVFVEADDQVVLMKKPLAELMGKPTEDDYWKTHYPYETWADDVDNQDFWTDGKADILRGPNKIANTWFSQEVEARTLASFGMNYYRHVEGWDPEQWDPVPGGFYEVPAATGEPLDNFIKRVDINPLDGNLDVINFLTGVAEKASGATATLQGETQQNQITLGEVQLALGQAKERVKGTSKFYTPTWVKRAYKFLKIIEAGEDRLDVATITKKGRNTDKMYSREVAPSDYLDIKGYSVQIWSQDEKDAQDTKSIEKLNLTAPYFAGNPKFAEIQQRKLLEFDDLNPDEITEIMLIEDEKRAIMASMQQSMMGGGMGMPGQPIGQPPMGGAPMGQPMQPQQPQPAPQMQPNGGMIQ